MLILVINEESVKTTSVLVMVMKALVKMSLVNTCFYSLLILFAHFLQVAYSTALLHEEYCNGNNDHVDLSHLDG